jgi:hypothetical protein
VIAARAEVADQRHWPADIPARSDLPGAALDLPPTKTATRSSPCSARQSTQVRDETLAIFPNKPKSHPDPVTASALAVAGLAS